MKLDTFISILRSILLKDGNINIYVTDYHNVDETRPLEDKDIYISDTCIVIGNLTMRD